MDYDIVTSADEGYAHFIKNLAANCLQIFNKKLIVYDLGLLEETKKTIEADYIEFKTSEEYKAINSKNSIRATHKPRCILDYFHRAQGKFLFLDADCLFVRRPNFPDADVCLTFRIYSEQTKSDFAKNGIINSGVIFIDPTSAHKNDTELLLKEWISRCEINQDSTDQKTLSDILLSLKEKKHPDAICYYNESSIKLLRSELYNDVKRKTGDILHFKAASRRKEKMQEYVFFCKMTKFIFLIHAYLGINKTLLFLKRKINPGRYERRYVQEMRNYE
ncbi:hypothetical protein H4684_003026 [Desulfomicrobium macestii]|uniref:Nucleotide-diphospho-sugar transferase domain-containing protein n=1 Tax=Desulfomicrobium macestii TaxID=90731 RepID=A0ABR9H6N9_9BACT|nr:putative nucleotide-diphospho-sugar transferase [Desulfomicrobium macestii]MBE1426361.1 hypothetical protein [Desulfomicrobium macestii]